MKKTLICLIIACLFSPVIAEDVIPANPLVPPSEEKVMEQEEAKKEVIPQENKLAVDMEIWCNKTIARHFGKELVDSSGKPVKCMSFWETLKYTRENRKNPSPKTTPKLKSTKMRGPLAFKFIAESEAQLDPVQPEKVDLAPAICGVTNEVVKYRSCVAGMAAAADKLRDRAV
jgi:hypothetical protein